MEALATLAPAVAEIDILMDVRLIEIDQRMLLIPGAIQQRANLPTKASRRSGSARPSSFLAFFHDRSNRRSAARMVSRQHRRPNRSRTNATRRLSVKRGGGSAPATGGLAASC